MKQKISLLFLLVGITEALLMGYDAPDKNAAKEYVYYFDSLDYDRDKFTMEERFQDFRKIPLHPEEERAAELVKEYFQERNLYKETPDEEFFGNGRLLAQYYSDETRRITGIIFYAQDFIVCATLYWDELQPVGTLAYECDKEERCIQETFYASEKADVPSAHITYDYIEAVPIPFITEYEREDDESGKIPVQFSCDIEDIFNRTQRFWFYRDKAVCDETGRWQSYDARLHSGDKAVCTYDSEGRLEKISEESEEFKRDFGDAYSGEITFSYRADGSLETMKHSFVTARRNTYDSSGTAYYDEQGRMIYREYYVTHGRHYCIYLYPDGNGKNQKRPRAYIEICSQVWDSNDDGTSYGSQVVIYLFETTQAGLAPNETDRSVQSMEDEKMLYCENCHALISPDSAKCPYCGALNAVGGEKQYMENLFELKEDVEELKDVPLQTYRQELGKSSRIIKRTLIICGIVAVLVFGVFLGVDKLRYSEIPVAARKEQLLWEKENFPKLDALYADGDYDGILEFEAANCADGYYSIYGWKHSDFISVYRWYLFCEESVRQAEAKNYDDDSVQQCILDAMYVLQEKSYATYDAADRELVDSYQAAVREILSSRFNMQAEDFNALYEKCCKEDEYGTYFDYKLAEKKVRAYIKNNMENGKVVR